MVIYDTAIENNIRFKKQERQTKYKTVVVRPWVRGSTEECDSHSKGNKVSLII